MVFIDETWAKTNMTRTHGWSDRGVPLIDKVPHGHWKTLTFIAGLRHDGIVAPCVIDGPINGESFAAWVEQFLIVNGTVKIPGSGKVKFPTPGFGGQVVGGEPPFLGGRPRRRGSMSAGGVIGAFALMCSGRRSAWRRRR